MTEQEWLASNDPQVMLEEVETRRQLNMKPPHIYRVSNRKLRLFACACCRQVWDRLTDDRSRRAVEAAERYADEQATEGERQNAYEVLPRPGDANYVSSGSSLVINCLMPNGLRQYAVLGELLNNSVEVCPECDGDGELVSSHRHTCSKCQGSGMRCGTGKGILPYAIQANLLRCIIGNPFRPLALKTTRGKLNAKGEIISIMPEWWDYDYICKMARAIYDDRDFSQAALSAFHDALIEAGCPETKDCPTCFGTGDGTPTEISEPPHYSAKFGKCYGCKGAGEVPNPVLEHLRGPGPHARGCHVIDAILGKE